MLLHSVATDTITREVQVPNEQFDAVRLHLGDAASSSARR
ncbi:hypothetical protein VPARA_28090 [Variovorax paradoxus]|uniref:Uncharacterized protein n=1 Tax=Variovorax paradoxus TaxID=34073 RepID=A0A0H2M1Z4_VARPD|nr:hypothetical protein VPARA_28090 [Variovorax paradoxus]